MISPQSVWDFCIWKSPKQGCVEAIASTPRSITVSPIALVLWYQAFYTLINRLLVLQSQQVRRVLYHGDFSTPHFEEIARDRKCNNMIVSSISVEFYH